ncbi:methyltransferase domain-containing protein [Fibrella sp. USSR17]
MNAVDFHSDIASAFGNRYQQSADFRERFAVWTSLFNIYVLPGAHVLDAGCGTGVFSRYLASRQCRVLGIDGSAEMIRLCQQQSTVPAATFRVAILPLTEVPAEAPFDVIVSSSVLEYVPDLTQTLQTFDQYLRPGGYLMLSLPNRRSIYRRLERLAYTLIGRPPYLKHVVQYATPGSVATQLPAGAYQLLTQQSFGGTNTMARLLRNCLPATYADTLFVVVFQKK